MASHRQAQETVWGRPSVQSPLTEAGEGGEDFLEEVHFGGCIGVHWVETDGEAGAS